jgi:RHS repeat-associated protein
LLTTTITVTVTPVAGFTLVPRQGIAPLVVQFTDTSSSGVDQWLWRFGDGGSSVVRHPVYTYTQSGVFTVTQTVTEITSGGRDTLTRTHYITVSGTGGSELVTRVITYTYDGLYRLAEADYSGGENFQYAYDAVGNRKVYTATITQTKSITYSYDAANRLTSVNNVAYTWDNRGHLLNDGVFTYTYNAAGHMVSARSITLSLFYKYNGNGLRTVQNLNGAVTTFTWDLALGVPKMLSDGESLYLIGAKPIGKWNESAWTYYLPDALGSIRQQVDSEGKVISNRQCTPFGVEMGESQSGIGYTGEWLESKGDLIYLRARWLKPSIGRFMGSDPWPGSAQYPAGTLPGWHWQRHVVWQSTGSSNRKRRGSSN